MKMRSAFYLGVHADFDVADGVALVLIVGKRVLRAFKLNY